MEIMKDVAFPIAAAVNASADLDAYQSSIVAAAQLATVSVRTRCTA
ncbi:hypothetical protein [Xanthomonas sp. 4461]|nr:hypothetical protein [Xanthomonas sp. 4461]MCS3811346.1 hypothetical protein [Xanthomonas sp. 4461]